MNNWASNLIIAVIFLVLGYFLYPIVNAVDNLESANIENYYQNLSSNEEVKQEVIKTASTATESHSQGTEPPVNTEIDLGSQESGESHPQKVASVDETGSSSINKRDTHQNAELIQWAEQHKNKINDLITAHAPDAVAEHMVKKVYEDNDFLSAPELKQDLEQDENWAYNTEQELKTYINNHKFAEQFQLLNLSCKQLTCDILGIEKTPQAWLQIFFSMFSNINNLLPPDEAKPTRSVSYMNGDNTSTIYHQLQFKAS